MAFRREPVRLWIAVKPRQDAIQFVQRTARTVDHSPEVIQVALGIETLVDVIDGVNVNASWPKEFFHAPENSHETRIGDMLDN